MKSRRLGLGSEVLSAWAAEGREKTRGQIRYTTTIADPASSLNGRSVSVSYTDGVPDFSQLGKRCPDHTLIL